MNYLFVGNQPELKDEAIRDKKRTLLEPRQETLNFNLYYMGEGDFNSIRDSLYSMPFLSEKRVVVLKNFHRASKQEIGSILSYLEKPAKATCLILDADGDFEKSESFPKIARFIKVKRFDKSTDSTLNAWLNSVLSRLGKQLDYPARELLKELAGDDLTTLKKELEKLAVFTGTSPEIRKRDIEMLTGKSKRDSIFDMAGSILRKDINKALRIIGHLFLNGQSPHEILGLLAWQFRTLLKARILLKEKLPPRELASKLNTSSLFINRIIKECRTFQASSIERNLELILASDIAIKKGEVASNELALEVLLVELCKD